MGTITLINTSHFCVHVTEEPVTVLHDQWGLMMTNQLLSKWADMGQGAWLCVCLCVCVYGIGEGRVIGQASLVVSWCIC